MKISVCASITYYYTIDVPDKLCDLEKDGSLKNEAQLLNFCCDSDPLDFSGDVYDVVGDIVSIRGEANDEEFYIGY